jgi:hypothetical protein
MHPGDAESGKCEKGTDGATPKSNGEFQDQLRGGTTGTSFSFLILPPDVLTRITIGKYAAVLVCNNICTRFAKNLQNKF